MYGEMKSGLFFLLLLMLSETVCGRTFTDSKGREIDAEICGFDGEKVELKLNKNGKIYEIAISVLCEEDQAFVRQWREQEKTVIGASGEDVVSHPNGNFDADWPRLVSVEIGIDVEVLSENEVNEEFVYHSPNYEFVSDVKLTKSLVKKFAVMFEATREFCRLLPISTMKAHLPGEQFRNKILLFEHEETYIKNGGIPGSAGVFVSRGGTGVVMVPLTSLGVIKGKAGFRFDWDGSNKTLPHELTHQLTDVEYFSSGARGWFSEGLAEYVAVTPYRSGKYMVRSNLDEIRDYVTAYGEKGNGGRALGEKFTAPDLEQFMMQSYESFIQNANFNYGVGLLLTYYFFHMEDDRSNIVAFLKALKEGKSGQEAVDVLLNGRTYNELEEQVSRAWKSRGIKISFE